MVALGSSPAWAVLGQSVASVAADQQRLRGELRSRAGDGYDVHEIVTGDGTLVREYVSPVGQVFGIAWQGPTRPDLGPLLGEFFAAFQKASRTGARRRGPLVVRTDELVVEMGGHMRAFHGRAYLPLRLPGAVAQTVVR